MAAMSFDGRTDGQGRCRESLTLRPYETIENLRADGLVPKLARFPAVEE